jgi:uncharacterized protein YecA (UPF0149 family)
MSPDRFESRFERKREEKERRKKNLPGADEEPLPPPVDTIKNEKEEPKRNDPCPCGSGRKYKQCCLGKKKSKGWFSRWKR